MVILIWLESGNPTLQLMVMKMKQALGLKHNSKVARCSINQIFEGTDMLLVNLKIF